jgi:sugar/nucleoside kinase (ribokinase family)
MPEAVCFGMLVADVVGAVVDALPERGSVSLLDRVEIHVGGCAANTGAALARLGVSTAVLGKVGTDHFGDFVVSRLGAAGVETAGIVRDPVVRTAATMVCVHSDAERSFLHAPGANAALTAVDASWDAASGARLFHVAGLQLLTALEGDGLRQLLEQARGREMLTSLDTVANPRSMGWPGIAPSLPLLDWVLPSFEEARDLTGESKALRQARRLQSAGATNVAIKMGVNGCLVVPALASGEAPFHVRALNVPAVDSLGAGDCWTAGFIAGLLRGWPLRQVARFANAVGACCVQHYGATQGVRSFADTLVLLADDPPEDPEDSRGGESAAA